MNETPSQQLSALIDGELDSHNARFLLRRMNADEALSAHWTRWHLARACLRGEFVAPLRSDFAQGIAAALAAEAAPRRSIGGRVLHWSAGMAVAASVAVAALLMVPRVSGPEMAPADNFAATPSTAPAQVAASPLTERDLRPDLGRVAHTVAAGTDARSLGPAIRLDPQVDVYLRRHGMAVQRHGETGFVPYLPVAAPQRPWSMLPTVETSSEPAH